MVLLNPISAGGGGWGCTEVQLFKVILDPQFDLGVRIQ